MRPARLSVTDARDRRYGDAPTTRIRRDGRTDIDLILVMDDSAGTTWTDPDDHRYVSARRLVTALTRSGGWSHYLRVRGRRRLSKLDRTVIAHTAWAADRVGLVSFTERVTRTKALTALPESIDELRAFLGGPGPSGGTALAPGLVAASRLLGGAAARSTGRPRRPVIAVFTDGDVSDDPADLHAAYRLLPPGSIRLITLADSEPSLPVPCDDDDSSTLFRLTDLTDPADLEHLLARAVED